MDRQAYVRSMRTLEAKYPSQDWTRGLSSFEVLVSTILSQSTTVANERRGMDGLREAFGEITAAGLAKRSEREIARAIWHAGLARQKAARIRIVARTVATQWDGRLEPVLVRPTDEARRTLMDLPGVGPKTADVVLAMAGHHPVFPIDTHIARIADRWNLRTRRGYEALRRKLETWTPPGRRRSWHLALIAHGRTLCTARAPRCEVCPVRRDCDWYQRRKTPRRKTLKGPRR